MPAASRPAPSQAVLRISTSMRGEELVGVLAGDTAGVGQAHLIVCSVSFGEGASVGAHSAPSWCFCSADTGDGTGTGNCCPQDHLLSLTRVEQLRGVDAHHHRVGDLLLHCHPLVLFQVLADLLLPLNARGHDSPRTPSVCFAHRNSFGCPSARNTSWNELQTLIGTQHTHPAHGVVVLAGEQPPRPSSVAWLRGELHQAFQHAEFSGQHLTCAAAIMRMSVPRR